MSWLDYGLLHLNNVKPGLKIELRRDATCLCCPQAHIHTHARTYKCSQTQFFDRLPSPAGKGSQSWGHFMWDYSVHEKSSASRATHTHSHTLPVSYCHLEAEENNKASGYGPARHKDNGYSMCDSHAHTQTTSLGLGSEKKIPSL